MKVIEKEGDREEEGEEGGLRRSSPVHTMICRSCPVVLFLNTSGFTVITTLTLWSDDRYPSVSSKNSSLHSFPTPTATRVFGLVSIHRTPVE